MKISIFGLGYVGTVSAACLASEGHQVTGVDLAENKVDFINRGQSPVIEAEIGEMIAANKAKGTLTATTDATRAVHDTDLSFVCVGTPSQLNGNLDLRHIRHICEQIGAALRQKSTRHTVVIRSTILPGTMGKVVIPIIEEFSKSEPVPTSGFATIPNFFERGRRSAISMLRRKP